MHTTVFTKGILGEGETSALLDQVEEEPDPLSQPTSALVKQVLAYIHENYTQLVTRKDIAAAVGVSENYLSQIFRQEMTLSPWDYLNRFRIQQAKELLSVSSETITQIATRVGFNDSAYFSRVFRKHTGQSPMDYRKLPR
jgi:YesN/AraC family two-component response regulator